VLSADHSRLCSVIEGMSEIASLSRLLDAQSTVGGKPLRSKPLF
jgi:hypothetical protein